MASRLSIKHVLRVLPRCRQPLQGSSVNAVSEVCILPTVVSGCGRGSGATRSAGTKAGGDGGGAQGEPCENANGGRVAGGATKGSASSKRKKIPESEKMFMEELKGMRTKPKPQGSPGASARSTETTASGSDGDGDEKSAESNRDRKGDSGGDEADDYDASSSLSSGDLSISGMITGYLRGVTNHVFQKLIRGTTDEAFDTAEFLHDATAAIDTVCRLSARYDPTATQQRKSVPDEAEKGEGVAEAAPKEEGEAADPACVGDEAFDGIVFPLGVTALREMFEDYQNENMRRVFEYLTIDDVAIHEGGTVSALSVEPFMNAKRHHSGGIIGEGWRTRPMRIEDTSISSYHAMMSDETVNLLEIEPLHGDLKKLSGSYLAISVKVQGTARISYRSLTSGQTVYEGIDDTPRVWTFVRGPLPHSLPASNLDDLNWRLVFPPLHNAPTLRFYGLPVRSRLH